MLRATGPRWLRVDPERSLIGFGWSLPFYIGGDFFNLRSSSFALFIFFHFHLFGLGLLQVQAMSRVAWHRERGGELSGHWGQQRHVRILHVWHMQSCCEYNGPPTAQRTKKMDSVNRHTARERPVSSKERTKSPWNQKSITICEKHSRSFSTSPFCSLQSDKLAIYTRQVLLNHKTSLLILSQLLNSHSYHFCFCPTPVSSS